MSQRETRQLSMAEALVRRRAGVNERWDRIAALIDWTAVAAALEPLQRSHRGAPGYEPLQLFKAVLLAQWHGLSDEAMEEALADRQSFRRFAGFDLADGTPDHTTLWRFREALGASGAGDAAFTVVAHQLAVRGLMMKQGTLLDATLVEAQAVAPPPPPAPPAPEAAANGRPPSRLVRSEADPDAGWTRRGKVRFFGYKGHVAVDHPSGLIRAQCLTGAEVNETAVADALIQGDERAVYADKAYDSHARRQWLRARRIKYRIQRRGNKHHQPSQRLVLLNTLIGKVRARVETVFAFLKRICGYRRVRYFNRRRNATQFALLCTAYNLNRALKLVS
jgi:IS5 family transposase